MKFRKSYWKQGQNTAEYLIMLTLVAVASIGLFTMFGSTLRNKISMVTAAISGEEAQYTQSQQGATTAASTAAERAGRNVEMRGQLADELNSGAGN